MKPEVYRTPQGEVFQNGSKLSLHNGFWWWDAGCAIAPEGQEVNLPIYDEEKDVIYCCDEMAERATHKCEQHPDPFQCPDNLIFYSEKQQEFGIIVHDGGPSYIRIKHCPWCGKDISSVSVPDRT